MLLSIPFVIIDETDTLFLIVICGTCLSWWFYLGKTEGFASFGLPPKDKGAAWESIIWMLFTSLIAICVVIVSVSVIAHSINLWMEWLIPASAVICSIRIMISCILLGNHGIKFLRDDHFI